MLLFLFCSPFTHWKWASNTKAGSWAFLDRSGTSNINDHYYYSNLLYSKQLVSIKGANIASCVKVSSAKNNVQCHMLINLYSYYKNARKDTVVVRTELLRDKFQYRASQHISQANNNMFHLHSAQHGCCCCCCCCVCVCYTNNAANEALRQFSVEWQVDCTLVFPRLVSNLASWLGTDCGQMP